MIKAGAAAEFAIGLCGTRGNGDCLFQRLTLPRFANEIQPIAVRQAEIADQNVEAQVLEELDRIVKIFSDHNLVAGANEKFGKSEARVAMIFDNENVHTVDSKSILCCV